MYNLSCLISHIRCTKKGLETSSDLVKMFILLLCTYIGQYKGIKIGL